ncbi:MAG: hypothetical protein ACFCVC_04010 [Acidimicrobiia bacterium]
MRSERLFPVLGLLLALTMAVMFIARRRAGMALPDVAGAPSDENGEAGFSDEQLIDDRLVDEMGRESFPASDPPATY